MSAVEPLGEPVPVLAGFLPPDLPGPAPLRILLPARELVQVTARRGAMVGGATLGGLGLVLPPPGATASAGDLTALWLQPNAWLLTAPRAGEGALLARAAPFAGAAALVDQSHGRCTIRLEGARARAVLAKGCRIDLHPRAFGPGRVAATQIAHLSCLLHQTDADGYELIAFATLAANLLEWLAAAAAEHGYAIA